MSDQKNPDKEPQKSKKSYRDNLPASTRNLLNRMAEDNTIYKNFQLVAEIAEEAGIDPATAVRIAQIESEGVANAVPRDPKTGKILSSARGIFQFMPDTATDVGLALEDRFDVEKSTKAFATLYKRNQRILENALGRKPEPWEMYLAHQQGAGAARDILTSDQNENLIQSYKDRGLKNPEGRVLLNYGQKDDTRGKFAARWKAKYLDEKFDGVQYDIANQNRITRNSNQLIDEAIMDEVPDPVAKEAGVNRIKTAELNNTMREAPSTEGLNRKTQKFWKSLQESADINSVKTKDINTLKTKDVNTLKTKEIQKMGNGGFMKGLKNAGVFTADNILSVFGANTVMDDHYSDDSKLEKISEVSNKLYGVAGQIAAGAVGGPAASMALGAVQQGVGAATAKPAEIENSLEARQDHLARRASNIRKMAEGGMITEGDIMEFKGPRHEKGGISIGNNIEVEGGEVAWKNFVFTDRF